MADQIDKLFADIEALNDNPNVFEPNCGECDFIVEDGECRCDKPTRIFVGKTPCDGDAWGAAGTLLDIVQRATPILRSLRAEAEQRSEFDAAIEDRNHWQARAEKAEAALTMAKAVIDELKELASGILPRR